MVKKRPEDYTDKELDELIEQGNKALEEGKKPVHPDKATINRNQEIEANLMPLIAERVRRQQSKRKGN